MLLQNSAVQTWLARRATSYLSNQLETEISIDRVAISLFLDVELKGVLLKDQKGAPMIVSESINLDLDALSLRKKELLINALRLEKPEITFRKYRGEDDLNLKFLTDYFASDTSDTAKADPWLMGLEAVHIRDGSFTYWNENKDTLDYGIDFNHLSLSELQLSVTDLSLNGDTIGARIESLALKELSGFKVDKLTTLVEVYPGLISCQEIEIQTARTSAFLDLDLKYKDPSDFQQFVKKVKLDGEIKPSKINLADVAYFAPELTGTDAEVSLEAKVKGKVKNLKIRDLNLATGQGTRLSGEISFNGLPLIQETFIHVKAEDFSTTRNDLASFNIPDNKGGSRKIEIPEIVDRLGRVRINGQFTGFISDFVAYASFNTALGLLSSDLSLRRDPVSEQLAYKGKLKATGFDLGKLLNSERELGRISFKSTVDGSGLTESTISAQIDGEIDSVELMGYTYTNTVIEGHMANNLFDGVVHMDDPNAGVDFTGKVDFSNERPVFDFYAAVDNLNLKKTKLFERENESVVSSRMRLNLVGIDLDEMEGEFTIDSTVFREGGEEYAFSKLDLSAYSAGNGNKTLKVVSGLANVHLSGRFLFSALPYSIDLFMKDYLPSFSFDFEGETPEIDSLRQSFSYSVKVNDMSPLLAIFVPGLEVAPKTQFKGSYDFGQRNLTINGSAPSLGWKGQTFEDWVLKAETKGQKIDLGFNCSKFHLSDSLFLEAFSLHTQTRNDSIAFNILWDDSKEKQSNKGDLSGTFSFLEKPLLKLSFSNADIVLQDSLWTIDRSHFISIDSSAVHIKNFMLTRNGRSLKLDGVISKNPSDKLKLSFRSFDASEFDPLTSAMNIDADGTIDGFVDIRNLYDVPGFIAHLRVSDFAFNKEKLGTALLISTWDKEKKGANINCLLEYKGNVGVDTTMAVYGWYYPSREEDNFDLKINISNFKLRSLEPYMEGLISRLGGKALGTLSLKGTPAKPELSGELKIVAKVLKIDYLQTTYSFTGDVVFNEEEISFKDIILFDMNNTIASGNEAKVSGRILHQNFRDFVLDIQIHPDQFTCLNTGPQDNSLFYGTAIASGLVNITGPINQLKMDVKAKTEKGSFLVIPVTSSYEVSESSFISFISTEKELDTVVAGESISGLQLDFDLEVTPDATMQIDFDPKIGDRIKGKGEGNLKMSINTNGDFQMFGDYVISSGDYLFTLENVINKHFTVVNGGTVSWTGDPYEAQINLQAVYDKPRAPLSDLVYHLDSSEVYKKKFQVECLLGLQGDLFNPAINFGIRLPNSDEKTRQLLFTALDTTNEQELTRQVFSLLILNRFMPHGQMYNNPLGQGVGANSFEMLSSQLSNWLSQISNDFDIGFTYRPGDEINSDQVELALKTQLFNEKLIIDGNVVAGTRNTQNTSNIVGDVNVEYKLSDDGKFRVKAFNRSNNVDMLDENSPYTQGVGFYYRREFDSWKELLKRRNKVKD